jgi:peptidoglycan/LPS O-acetylase OafA/YrhL
MASNWFDQSFSFNTPIWSVSVEVALYAIFFFVCINCKTRWWELATFAGIGVILANTNRFNMLGRGCFQFFYGGLLFYLFLHLRCKVRSRDRCSAIIALLVVAWVVISVNAQHQILYHQFQRIFGPGWGMIHGKDVGGAAFLTLSGASLRYLLFPLTILSCALLETYRGTLGRRMALLGDLSYSIYLIHLPLQLAFIGVAWAGGFTSAVFERKGVFLCFFVSLFGIAYLSHRFFERPAQKFIRLSLIKSNA